MLACYVTPILHDTGLITRVVCHGTHAKANSQVYKASLRIKLQNSRLYKLNRTSICLSNVMASEKDALGQGSTGSP